MDEAEQTAAQLATWIEQHQAFSVTLTAAITSMAEAVAAIERRVARIEAVLFVENN